MNRPRTIRSRLLLALVPAAAALAVLPAAAKDHHRIAEVPQLKLYSQECAACHAAYPPRMLPPESWRRMMDGLESHYGTDASLDAKDVQLISQWLTANANERRRDSAPPPEDRITRARWFVKKHRRIEPATWRLQSVRSAANCAACHTDTDRGRFDDHALRMPEGLSMWQRLSWHH